MRLANLNGRCCIVTPDGRAVDLSEASEGRFPAAMEEALPHWRAIRSWARQGPQQFDALADRYGVPFALEDLGPVSPRPGQVFAIGMNYRAHAREFGHGFPSSPPVFTKFPSCVTGPVGEVDLPAGCVDWEVELVVVIGQDAHHVGQGSAWEFVAGLTTGQDLSERSMQMAGDPPQFSLGKSFPGFGPIGPWLVTPDEFEDPDDVSIECRLNGDVVQTARTSDLIFSVPELIAHLSSVVTLRPGDLIFTGTPAGVGMGRVPPRWLTPGDELCSRVTGIGEMRHVFRQETPAQVPGPA
jgi:2,4-didehydro-3-deoxy-L-rhamnonate hydrolase